MAGQPIVLTVELVLDEVVPFSQAFYQRLVVGDKGNSGSATTAASGGTGIGWGDSPLGNEGPDDDATGGSP